MKTVSILLAGANSSDYYIWGGILLFCAIILISYLNYTAKQGARTLESHLEPHTFTEELAGEHFLVQKIEKDKILLQHGSVDIDWPTPPDCFWYWKKDIPKEFQNQNTCVNNTY